MDKEKRLEKTARQPVIVLSKIELYYIFLALFLGILVASLTTQLILIPIIMVTVTWAVARVKNKINPLPDFEQPQCPEPIGFYKDFGFPIVIFFLCIVFPRAIPLLVLLFLGSVAIQKIICLINKNDKFPDFVQSFKQNPWTKPMLDGVPYVKPIIFTALYFAAAPISVMMIMLHWIYKLFKPESAQDKGLPKLDSNVSLFKQNIPKQTETGNAFYNSPAFSITMILVSAIGFPTLIAMSLFQCTDVKDIIYKSSVHHRLEPSYNFNKTDGSTTSKKDLKYLSTSGDAVDTKLYIIERAPMADSSDYVVENYGLYTQTPNSVIVDYSAPTNSEKQESKTKNIFIDTRNNKVGLPPTDMSKIELKDDKINQVNLDNDSTKPEVVYLREAKPLRGLSSLKKRKNYIQRELGIDKPTEKVESSPERLAALLYIFSIGWCISTLFIRAYFVFPLNFASTEYDIELNPEGVKKHPIKGWFSEMLWYTWPAYLPKSLAWSKVKRIAYEEDGIGQLSPLPDSIFPKESLMYKLLNRMALLIDALHNKVGRSQYLSISDNPDAPSGNEIRIRLWELTTEEKAKLFYSIKNYAPSVFIDRIVQEKLLGTQVNDEPKYTQIWFDILMSDTKEQKSNTLPSGTKLKDYQVRYRINSGGQANIYLAKNSKGQNFVLKEFTLSCGESFGAILESASDFENEALILSSVSNDSIVQLEDFFAEDKRAYLVLEHVKGKTLREFVEESSSLEESVVVDFVIQLCEALEHLHNMDSPVIHCDFTPENIMVTPDNKIKVIDFSVAKTEGGTRTNSDCVGKHSYTPPEQFRAESTCQSDIYALGATIAFMLTGLDPKPISTTDLSESEIDVSSQMIQIVKKATSLDLETRYESVSWMKLELQELFSALDKQPDTKKELHAKNLIRNMEESIQEKGEIEDSNPIKINIRNRKQLVKKDSA